MKSNIARFLIFALTLPAFANAKPKDSVIKKTDLPIFEYVATYNKADFLKEPDVAKAINVVMPKTASFGLYNKLRVGPPIDYIRGYVVASGCMQTTCAKNEAQVWYNLGNKSAIVMVKSGGVFSVYAGNVDWWTLPQAFKAKILDGPGFDRAPANVKMVKIKPPTPSK